VTDKLSEKARALIARPILASLATLTKDGGPQVTPLWIEVDGDDLLVNTARGRAKARNVERDPRVALTVVDPNDQYNVVAVQGTVIDMTPEGANAHIDRLAKKYLGVDVYPMHQPDEVRLTIRIRTDHIPIQPS
jgi:PPOX class probable F420-dependent enzyme